MNLEESFTDISARIGDFISRCKGGVSSAADFNRLALDLAALQFKTNAPFRRLCEARGVLPGSIGDWRRIPAMPTAAFKELEVTSLTPEQRVQVFHSSGTTDQTPSRHFHDEESMALYETSLKHWFERNVLEAFALPARFGLLTPPAADAPNSSLAHMFATVKGAFGAPDSAWLGAHDDSGAWAIDPNACLAFLESAVADQRPVVLLGTAFLFVHLIDSLQAAGRRFALPDGSRVMETGGYKGRSRELSREELHRLIAQYLGVEIGSILREYGMSELSSQAYARADRAVQFPPWARATVISPETGLEVAVGDTGLVRIVDLANVRSVAAIQTEDLGVRRDIGFELLGRASMAEPRGCSRMTV